MPSSVAFIDLLCGDKFSQLAQRSPDEVRQQTQLLQAVIPEVLAQRWMGPASLSLAWLAAGQLDAYWEIGRSLHDWIAGALLASEAGAILSDLEGAPISWDTNEVLIAQAGIHAELRNKLHAASRALI